MEYNGFEINTGYHISTPFEMFPEIKATNYVREYCEFFDYHTGRKIIKEKKVSLGDATVVKQHIVTIEISLKAPVNISESLIKQVIDKYNSLGDLSDEFREYCKSIRYEMVISYNDEII